jgi:hypothetical protein
LNHLFIKSEKAGKREAYSKPVKNRAINKLLLCKMHANDAQQVDICIPGLECFYTKCLMGENGCCNYQEQVSTPGSSSASPQQQQNEMTKSQGQNGGWYMWDCGINYHVLAN